MKPVRFHPEAEAEMIEAASYYEAQQPDLGRRFLASVHESLTRIQVNPRLYTLVDEGVRRCLTRTFPYGVVFRDESDQCVVIAVMHLHRDPGYWQKRVPPPKANS